MTRGFLTKSGALIQSTATNDDDDSSDWDKLPSTQPAGITNPQAPKKDMVSVNSVNFSEGSFENATNGATATENGAVTASELLAPRSSSFRAPSLDSKQPPFRTANGMGRGYNRNFRNSQASISRENLSKKFDPNLRSEVQEECNGSSIPTVPSDEDLMSTFFNPSPEKTEIIENGMSHDYNEVFYQQNGCVQQQQERKPPRRRMRHRSEGSITNPLAFRPPAMLGRPATPLATPNASQSSFGDSGLVSGAHSHTSQATTDTTATAQEPQNLLDASIEKLPKGTNAGNGLIVERFVLGVVVSPTKQDRFARSYNPGATLMRFAPSDGGRFSERDEFSSAADPHSAFSQSCSGMASLQGLRSMTLKPIGIEDHSALQPPITAFQPLLSDKTRRSNICLPNGNRSKTTSLPPSSAVTSVNAGQAADFKDGSGTFVSVKNKQSQNFSAGMQVSEPLFGNNPATIKREGIVDEVSPPSSAGSLSGRFSASLTSQLSGASGYSETNRRLPRSIPPVVGAGGKKKDVAKSTAVVLTNKNAPNENTNVLVQQPNLSSGICETNSFDAGSKAEPVAAIAQAAQMIHVSKPIEKKSSELDRSDMRFNHLEEKVGEPKPVERKPSELKPVQMETIEPKPEVDTCKDFRDTCMMCAGDATNCFLLPCLCSGLCVQCGHKFIAKYHKCPMCRMNTEAVKKI